LRLLAGSLAMDNKLLRSEFGNGLAEIIDDHRER